MHLTPSIGEHAYSAEEFAEEYDDEEREQYFARGGMYDITCLDCEGNKVVSAVDEEACKLDPKFESLLKIMNDFEEQQAMWDAESAAERRMGA